MRNKNKIIHLISGLVFAVLFSVPVFAQSSATITSVTPSSGDWHFTQTVTISGHGFGSGYADAHVSFRYASSAPIPVIREFVSWSDTQIIFIVPAEIKHGYPTNPGSEFSPYSNVMYDISVKYGGDLTDNVSLMDAYHFTNTGSVCEICNSDVPPTSGDGGTTPPPTTPPPSDGGSSGSSGGNGQPLPSSGPEDFLWMGIGLLAMGMSVITYRKLNTEVSDTTVEDSVE